QADKLKENQVVRRALPCPADLAIGILDQSPVRDVFFYQRQVISAVSRHSSFVALRASSIKDGRMNTYPEALFVDLQQIARCEQHKGSAAGFSYCLRGLAGEPVRFRSKGTKFIKCTGGRFR